MGNITVTLPDGGQKQYENAVSVQEIASDISKSLAKSAIVAKINGELSDLSTIIKDDCKLQILSPKDKESLEVIRHDAAHILAEAVKTLYPETQVTIGPVIEDGFYYDFHRETPFNTEDLDKIEKQMYRIIKRNQPIIKEIWNRDRAIAFFKEIGELYKVEIIASIPASEDISLYRQGNFIDLCRGPHSPSTGRVRAVKLTKVAGAYWRGDSNNVMLQRIYGTAWFSDLELKHYLYRLEEAKKRDHRKLGKELDLFHIHDEAVGQVFWHEKGWILYRIIEDYLRKRLFDEGYKEIKTPILLDKNLWEKSGHWEKFREHMFITDAEDKRTLAIKPMNCPGHVQVFNKSLKSYRELPLKYSEFGCCHRNEPSGALHGLMRVRGFNQDDAHIFCRKSDITKQTVEFCELLRSVYYDFGFQEIKVKFSDRPAQRAGSDEIWDSAENSLMVAVKETGLDFTINQGEGAFYGPKLEFVLTDAIGRDWQCGTLQVDFVMPTRLSAYYMGEDNQKHHPVMLHRAILGSVERFIGILIEEYSGKFPFWLAPTQVAVVTITEAANDYADQVYKILLQDKFRAVLDISDDKISYKIRKYSHLKIPLMLIVGEEEVKSNTVTMRRLTINSNEVIELSRISATLSGYSKIGSMSVYE